jgi:hypothetical protein
MEDFRFQISLFAIVPMHGRIWHRRRFSSRATGSLVLASPASWWCQITCDDKGKLLAAQSDTLGLLCWLGGLYCGWPSVLLETRTQDEGGMP